MLNRLIPTPTNLGPHDGRLNACPDSPNCVNSQADEAGHAIEPLRLHGVRHALDRLRDLVATIPGAALTDTKPGYLRFEFRTRVCRFVDDVEFLADPPAGVIHVRSASRLGYSDLGANRRRIEDIRRRWTATDRRA